MQTLTLRSLFPAARHSLAGLLALLLMSLAQLGYAAKANLPQADEVAPGKRSILDGTWRISGINKRVRIDRGRAVVIDGWKHLFLFDVEPGMVVIRDIRHTGNGKYTGQDLPLPGRWDATFDRHKWTLDAVVQGPLGPVPYTMTRENSAPDQPDVEERPVVEPEPQVATVYPIRVQDAKLPGCPGKNNYLSTLRGGSCWKCPNGYKRVGLRAMDSPRACAKAGTVGLGAKKPAKYNGTSKRCPSKLWHAPTKGTNGCFKCPKGYKREKIAGLHTGMCVVR